MDRSTTLDAVDLESSRFLVAVSSGTTSLDSPVSTCPGWDVAQLVNHLGLIYSRVALIVSSRRTEAPERSELPSAPRGEARLGWFAEQQAAMLAALENADDDNLVYNWTENNPGPVSVWSRRITHETLIHRVDAELAQGCTPAPAMPAVAADTVQEFFEFFELFVPRFQGRLVETVLGGSMHLHATDLEAAEWTLTPRSGGFVVTCHHERADVALRGTAFELARWIWGRLPTEHLEIVGDVQIADRFQHEVRL